MVDRSFAGDLEARFAEAPGLPDADRFALAVSRRLERNWTLRRLVIGGLGVAGGLIGGAQVLDSGLLRHLGAAEARPGGVAGQVAIRVGDLGVADWPIARGLAALWSATGPVNGEALAMSLALALLAGGLLLTRAIREI